MPFLVILLLVAWLCFGYIGAYILTEMDKRRGIEQTDHNRETAAIMAVIFGPFLLMIAVLILLWSAVPKPNLTEFLRRLFP